MVRGRSRIVQRIALEGAEDIQASLKALGEAGEAAFNEVARAAQQVNSPIARFVRAIDNARNRARALNTVGLGLGQSLSALGRSVGTVALRVTALGAALTGVGAGLVFFTKSGAEAADAAAKQAQAYGLTVEEFSALEFAANQSGVANEQFRLGLAKLAKAIDDTVKKTSKAADATETFAEKQRRFAEEAGVTVSSLEEVEKAAGGAAVTLDSLGVEVFDQSGTQKIFVEVLKDVADIFANLPDGAEKTALAFKFFGEEAGPRLIPFLNQGREGIERLEETAKRLGLAFNTPEAVIGTAFVDALNRLGTAATRVRQRLGLVFAPVLTENADRLANLVARNSRVLQEFARDINSRIKPVIEDLFNALSGNDADVNDKRILEIRDAVTSLGTEVRTAFSGIIIPAFNAIRSLLGRVAGAFNAAFGTNITGDALGIALVIGSLTGALGLLLSTLRLVSSAFLTLFATLGPIPALLIAAGVAIFLFWDDITEAAKSAVTAIDDAINSLRELFGLAPDFSIVDFFTRLDDAISRIDNAVTSAIVDTIKGLIDSVTSLLQALNSLPANVGGLFIPQAQAAEGDGLSPQAGQPSGQSAIPDGERIVATQADAALRVEARWRAATQTILGLFRNLASQVNTVFAQIVTQIGPAIEGAIEGLSNAIGGLLGNLSAVAGDLAQPFVDAANQAVQAFETAFNRIVSAAQQMASQIRSLIADLRAELRRLRDAISSARAASGGGGGSETFALGGMVHGPGTGTSDSVVARLSRGEFVIRRSAVVKYGPQLLNLINTLRLPKDELPRFQAGGLVDSLSQRFFKAEDSRFLPSGGLEVQTVSQGRPVVLQVGDETITGLTASEDAIDQMERLSNDQKLRSAGRLPSWVR